MDKKLFAIAKREYLERVRSRWFIVSTLLVPAIMSGAMLIPLYIASHSGASSAVRHIEILDATGVGLGDRIAAALMSDSSAVKDSIRPRVVVVSAADLPAKEQAATAEVELPDHIAGYLVLNDSTVNGLSARYAGRNASSISDMEKLESSVRQEVMVTRLQREGVRQDIVGDLANNRLKINSERLTERGRGGSGQAGLFAGIIIGVLLFMAILIHGQNVLRGVLEEKSTRVAEVVISSVKPETLLAGKVLGVGAVGLTQMGAWLGIGSYLLSFLTPIILKGTATGAAGAPSLTSALGSLTLAMLAITLGYFLIGFVFYATLYAAAGSMVNSEQEAQQAAMPVMFFAMSTWLLLNPVLINPTGKVAVVLSWLPWSSPIIMPIRLGLTTISPITIAGSMVVAVLGCVATVWLSARIYRVGMLMYGKKPSFAEVAKWIRYA